VEREQPRKPPQLLLPQSKLPVLPKLPHKKLLPQREALRKQLPRDQSRKEVLKKRELPRSEF
jgi:hypothetical protein